MVFILAYSISHRHLSCGFYSTHLPLKALPNIYHVPLLLQNVSALFSPSSPSPILSCRSSEQKQPPPQFVVSAGWLHVHQVPLPLHGFLRHDSSSSSTISSAPLFPSPPQGGVNTEYGDLTTLTMSQCVFLVSEKAVGNKREWKSRQQTKGVFLGEV